MEHAVLSNHNVHFIVHCYMLVGYCSSVGDFGVAVGS